MILWFHYSVPYFLYFLFLIFWHTYFVSQWLTFEENNWNQSKKTNRSQICNYITTATLQIQTRAGSKTINDLQRNFCTTSAHLKRMPAQREQQEHPSWPESLCSGGRSSPKPLLLLPKMCTPATVSALRKLADSLLATARRHSPDLWKSHMPRNSECTPREIREKKPNPIFFSKLEILSILQ